MKILLINPPVFNILDPSLPKILQEKEDPMPPLGLMYLAGYLEKNANHEISILDCELEKLNYRQVKERIRQKKPDIIAITTMTFTMPDVIKIAQLAKKINPKIKTILGGCHVYIYPEETMRIKEFDYCILGEGEKLLKELLDKIDDIRALYKIKGIAFRDDGKVVNTGPPSFIKDLDSLPFPARHLTLYKKYNSSLAKKFPITTMITSRGCPFRCLFCNRPHLGKIFRAHSYKKVVDEMEECRKMGIKEIFIYDDTFSTDRQRVLDICSEIIKRNLDIVWDVRTRVDTVDEEMLKKMKEAGCQRIHYGVEAGTQRILNVLRKGVTLEQIEKAFRWTKKTGIQTLGYFMMGSPTETREDILKTIKFMKKLDPDYAHVAITTPYPTTDLYQMGLEKKVLPYDYWREFAKNPDPNFKPLLWEEELSRKELFSLLKMAYRSFYFRPGYIVKKLIQLKSIKELIAKAKAALNILKV